MQWADLGRWDTGALRADLGRCDTGVLRLCLPLVKALPFLIFSALAPVLVPVLVPVLGTPTALQRPVTAPHALPFEVPGGTRRILIPTEERLEYSVTAGLGILGDARVGTVILSSGVDPYRPALLAPGSPVEPADGRLVGWMRSQAIGRYLGFSLDHELQVRLLPQEWPVVYYRDMQQGSKARRRELRIGTKDGRLVSEYLRDQHCRGCNRREHVVKGGLPWSKAHHCERCKRPQHRVWRPPVGREVPPGTVDLLTAVYMARELVLEDKRRMQMPLIDRDVLWMLTLTRGAKKIIETPAGKFECYRVGLAQSPPPGEERELDDFRGLFGLRGQIRIFLHATTGVPVVIDGELPTGLFKLSVRVSLRSYSGTLPGLAPIPR
jgi:hypothetical protein